MVIPRSCSKELESMETPSFAAPVCRNSASVSVVLPWSTCAIIAMFLISIFLFFVLGDACPVANAERCGTGVSNFHRFKRKCLVSEAHGIIYPNSGIYQYVEPL